MYTFADYIYNLFELWHFSALDIHILYFGLWSYFFVK